MIELFCRRNSYVLGSVLMLGSGEAILKTPFKYAAVRAIRNLAVSVADKHYNTFNATMPLSKKMFCLAANIHWTLYGKKFGTTKKQMQTMRIEG